MRVSFCLLALLAVVVWAALGMSPVVTYSVPELDWDPRLDNLHVTYEPAQDCSSGCWRLISARFEDVDESGLMHHVFVRLLDADGRHWSGQPWHLAWPDGNVRAQSKSAGEWSDVAMFGPGGCYRSAEGPGPYWAYAGDEQAQSDLVRGLGLPYCQHVNFRLVWQWDDGVSPSPEPSPTSQAPPPPTATPTQTPTPTPTIVPTSTSPPGTTPVPAPEVIAAGAYLPMLRKQMPPTPAVPPPPTATPTQTPTPTPTIVPTSTSAPGTTPVPAPDENELIRNGGFERDEAWYFAYNGEATGDYTGDVAYAGSRAARLGIEPPHDDPDGVIYSSVSQTVTIPADVHSATLSLWVNLRTEDDLFAEGPVPSGNDVQQVLLLDEHRSFLARLWTAAENSDAWQQLSFDLSDYKDRTVVVYVNVINDGDGRRSWLYLDEVSLVVEP